MEGGYKLILAGFALIVAGFLVLTLGALLAAVPGAKSSGGIIVVIWPFWPLPTGLAWGEPAVAWLLGLIAFIIMIFMVVFTYLVARSFRGEASAALE